MADKRAKVGIWPSTVPEYRTWRAMLYRCTVEHHFLYKNYGARGIKVCDGWRNSYDAFRRDMGPRPPGDYSIDRIDNDGNYSCGRCDQCKSNGWPANCRWATRWQQCQNQRRKRRYKGIAPSNDNVQPGARRWIAVVMIDGKARHLPEKFDSAEAAHAAEQAFKAAQRKQ